MKRHPGRPPLPAEQKIDQSGWVRITIRIRREDAEALQRAAEDEDRPLSAWCRRVLLRAMRPVPEE